jgi:ABC-type branched-subunit amino acid transport system ATPase component
MAALTSERRRRRGGQTGSGSLCASALTKHYGGVRALKGVALELPKGRVAGLIGPNGSGKTTLLNCISGVVRPTSGTVTLDDRDITRAKAADIARLGVARTFQNIRLFDRLTVVENVEVNALAAAGRRRRDAARSADRLLEEFGLSEHRDTYVGELSYGDRRRVEIARALAGEPRFVLLDEPTAGMNESETAQLGELIQQIRTRRGCGVLLVDHDLELIMLHCDEIKVLNQGEEIACGSPAEVQSNSAVIAAYIGDTSASAVEANPPSGSPVNRSSRV